MPDMTDKQKFILMRAYLIYIFVLIFGLVIIGRILYIQLAEGEFWKSQSENLIYKYENVEPTRGNIYSDNNSLLATSLPVYEIRMDLSPECIHDSIFLKQVNQDFKNVDSLAVCLQKLFNDGRDYKTELYAERRKKNRGYLIHRNVTYLQLKEIKTFPILRLGQFKGGLIVLQSERRELPFGELAERTLGYERLPAFEASINFTKMQLDDSFFSTRIDSLAEELSTLFSEISFQKFKEQLVKAHEKKDNHFIIKNNISEYQKKQLEKFTILKLGDKAGFSCKKTVKEYYVGLEGAYSKYLMGEPGKRLMQKIGNNIWKPVNDENSIEPVNGCDIYTSIDINLQDVADKALRECMDSTKASAGCAVLMEVETGFIKAIVNLSKTPNGKYKENYNYSIGELYEPGSTIKLASLIAVLEDGTYDTSTLVNVGQKQYYDKTMRDCHIDDKSKITVSKAFEESSNVGISEIVYKTFSTKPAKYIEYLSNMHLTLPCGIELAGEGIPQIKDPRKWDGTTLPWMSVGYELKLTPLQILTLYNAVANNGKLMKPLFVKEIRQTGRLIKKIEPIVLREKICSDNTIKKVRKLLEGVVQRGTATNIKKADYLIAGKTGTAKIYDPAAGRYIEKYVGSFCGYFPADEPKYSCIVVIFKPETGEYYGSQVAAPVFKRIADRVYATHLDIKAKEEHKKKVSEPPSSYISKREDLAKIYGALNFRVVCPNQNTEWAYGENIISAIKLNPVNPGSEGTPDVVGMCARDAVYILEKRGFNVILKGKGRVVKQINKANKIFLELSFI